MKIRVYSKQYLSKKHGGSARTDVKFMLNMISSIPPAHGSGWREGILRYP
jgi:hypothetical protein